MLSRKVTLFLVQRFSLRFFNVLVHEVKGDSQSVLHSVSTLIFIHIKTTHSMTQIDIIRYEPRTLSLKSFKVFFQQLHCIIDFYRCEVVSSCDIRNNEA